LFFFGIISYFPKKQLVFLRGTFGKKGVKGSVLFFWNLRKFQGIKDFVWGIKVFSGELRFFSGIKVFSGELRFFLFKKKYISQKNNSLSSKILELKNFLGKKKLIGKKS